MLLVVMTGKREQGLAIREITLYLKTKTLDMKITGTGDLAILCSSCRLLSKQGYAFSRDRQDFRAHTASVSK